MKTYTNEQKIFRAGTLEMGGQLGERPTVLIGSLFYEGHKAVQDAKTGEFDHQAVEGDIQLVLEWSDKTGLPAMFDIVGSYAPALERYVEFVSGQCQTPFLVDGTGDACRVQTMRRASEWGLLDRAILNSIEIATSDATLAEIRDIGVKHSVLLAFESRHMMPEKKVELLEGVPGEYKGLLQKAEEAGIESIIIDAAVLDVPSLGFCARAQEIIKETYGLPVGCAPPNAIFDWEKGAAVMGRDGQKLANAAACAFLRDHGADFILFGPCNKAGQVFPEVALVDSVLEYYQRRVNKVAIQPGPLSKLGGS
jgi:tetrahydromethanopterin S-methyltransferase subunit H